MANKNIISSDFDPRSSIGKSIIQLMYSFEVDIRICKPKISDFHRGEAEVNITFEGRLILMLTSKNAPIVSLFLVSYKVFSCL